VLAEREVLQHLPDHSQLIHQKQAFLTRVKFPLVLLVLRWDLPVPVPSSGMLPEGNVSFQDLRRQWDDNMVWLKSYIQALKPEALNYAVFRHPVAGPLTVAQAMDVDRMHIESHMRQTERMKKQLLRG
jgi:hypothetical protein